jgi:hypothetical protein
VLSYANPASYGIEELEFGGVEGLPTLGCPVDGSVVPPAHEWQEVAGAKCCVVIPSNLNPESAFEMHSLGIPLLMPTASWIRENSSGLSPHEPAGALTSREIEAMAGLSDWYSVELPGVTFFDSAADIPKLLTEALFPTHGQEERKIRISKLWTNILENIETASPRISGAYLSGSWRLSDGRIIRCIEDGSLEESSEYATMPHFRCWKATPLGFELKIDNSLINKIVLSTPESGLWYEEGSDLPGGSIYKLKRT